MLLLPKRGIIRSVKEDNSDPVVVADWIEASCMFYCRELSIRDVVDVLMEENIYDDQDMATNFINARWDELQRRARLTGSSYGIRVESQKVRTFHDWEKFPAHAFCLVLSLAIKYDWWFEHFQSNYNEQGELFEFLTAESLQVITPDWECTIGGWSRNTRLTFEELVNDVAARIGDGSVRLDDWKDCDQKDLTLDVLHYRHFLDELPGRPTTFIQCASGGDWKKKIGKPNLEVWKDVVRTFTPPTKGFAVPFCFEDAEFRRNCVKAQGLMLDRLRILSAGLKRETWLSRETTDRILQWLSPLIAGLLSKSNLS